MKRLALIFLLIFISSTCVWADRPAGTFKIFPKNTFYSASKALRLEQYANADWEWQIWAFKGTSQSGYLLTRPEDYSGYAAYFDMSPDERYLCREQKIGSGTHTAYIYELNEGQRYVPITKGPLGDLVFDFFRGQSKENVERAPNFHTAVGFVEWRQKDLLILSLSGIRFIDMSSNLPHWIIDSWKCAFNLKTKKFEMPPDLLNGNIGKIYKSEPPGPLPDPPK